jgi:hypothetical protein
MRAVLTSLKKSGQKAKGAMMQGPHSLHALFDPQR